jgi:aldehyde:ferredoxin oxidoreductase
MIDQPGFRVLELDLGQRNSRALVLAAEDEKMFLGGRGLAAKLLFQGQPAGVDPLGPENQLIFSTGRLVGTPSPTAGQLTITSLSPATGKYFKSNTGGHWARSLRRAGWDLVRVKGASPDPVYISIDDGDVIFHSAEALWGLTVREAQSVLLEQLKGSGWQTAIIGPAGENLVAFACIMTSLYHAAGRGGLGAVMGAKGLKAIAVRGTGAVEVAAPEALRGEIQRILNKVRESSKARLYLDYGTAATIEMAAEGGSLPVNNFSRSQIKGAHQISGTYLVEKGYMHRGSACSACPLGCHKHSRVNQGKFAGHSGGPEYETLAALGSGCGITNTEAVLKANELCNDYGMDTISSGAVIAWLMECQQRGVLPENMADGLDLSWGNSDTMVELIHRIAMRQGIGDLLAKGTANAARIIGGNSWQWAVEARGLDQSRVDTRGAKAYALAFAVNPRGPDHLHAQPQAEFGRHPAARELVKELLGSDEYCQGPTTEGKPELVRWHEDIFAVSDSLGICSFATTTSYVINPDNLAALFKTVTGIALTADQLMECGKRIIVLERCFNLREDPDHNDILPWRMMHDPVSEGPRKGMVNSPEELSGMLSRYYALIGYNKRGRPPHELIVNLGLTETTAGFGKIVSQSD